MDYSSSDCRLSVSSTLISDEELPDSLPYEHDFHMSPSIASSLAACQDAEEDLYDSSHVCYTSDGAPSTSEPIASQLPPSELGNP